MPLQSIPQLLFPVLSLPAALNPLNPFLEGSLLAWVIFAIHGLLTPYPLPWISLMSITAESVFLPQIFQGALWMVIHLRNWLKR